MSARGSLRPDARRAASVAVSLLALSLTAAGCSMSADADARDATGSTGSGPAAAPPEPTPTPVSVDSNVAPGAKRVAVDTKLTLTASHGTLRKVTVVGKGEERVRLPGKLGDDGTGWRATELLEPGSTYTVRTLGVSEDGSKVRARRVFRTVNLPLDQQTYPNISPLDGETVGVGMPVIVQFDVPVTNRAAIEKRLDVDASTRVRGSWNWYSDAEVHYRPKRFWKAGTEVTVTADINGVDAGNGVYGQLDRKVSFEVGNSVVSKVYIDKHQMDVFINGSLARSMPVTTGKPGFETRSGTKVVMEKFETKTMDAATTGVSENDPNYYNIEDVPYALRVTHSGEFMHGAPWSTGSQGYANVSHGCVGMSVDDAQWLFEQTNRGDVVKVFGSDRGLEKGNGWTDWDVSFAEYAKGSALS